MSNLSSKKILVVDDEPDILEFVSYNLSKEGFVVETADNGEEAINVAKKTIPDLILLDVMMPEMDGIETCVQLRNVSDLANTVIVFLSARAEDYSQIAGLDAGADDYITKPIRPRLLIAKINALLRRSDDTESQSLPNVDTISVDVERFLVKKGNSEFVLPKKEFELLALLMSKPGMVYTRDTILNTVWGNDVVVGDRTIDVHIRKLRQKLGEKFIQTIKGVGYKFVEN
jgi:two-component system alkaline phosphatase synthesis response regulator PhoP